MKTYEEMTHLFEVSNHNFLSKDNELLVSGVSERTLCGSLMSHIIDLIRNSPLYSGYFVDVEYNRNNGKLKTIKDNNSYVITVNCDLILHSRGHNPEQDNLIAIEMKKKNRPNKEKAKDRERLLALTKDSFDGIWSFDGKTLPQHVCRYLLGIYYEINTNAHEILIEYYTKGIFKNSYFIKYNII